MWCSSYCTPPQLPFRQIRWEQGDGKWFRLPYKEEVARPNKLVKGPRTTTERSDHEEEGTHREDRRGSRGAQERGPEALRGLEEVVTQALKAGEEVQITGFGKFSVKERKARE